MRASGERVALKLPATVENLQSMKNCFLGCTCLVSLAALPAGVANISCCFACCGSLIKAPAIPESVTNCIGCFRGCERLELSRMPKGRKRIEDCFTTGGQKLLQFLLER